MGAMFERFTLRDMVVMAVFAAVASSFFITTVPLWALMPIHMPGIYGIFVIPLATLFNFVGFGLVNKRWAATITFSIYAIVGLFIPGGPGPLKLIFIAEGIIIDLYLMAIRKGIHEAAWVAATAAFIPQLIDAYLFWLGFKYFFGHMVPALAFAAVFLGLHGALAIIGGLAAFYVLRRILRGLRDVDRVG